MQSGSSILVVAEAGWLSIFIIIFVFQLWESKNMIRPEEALNNKASYRHRARHIKAPVRLKYGLAEHYEVKPIDNCFYFFNPFSSKVFKKVVHNILQSIERDSRSADMILYYPTKEYKRVLKHKTPFRLLNKVRLKGASDPHEKFLIYRLSK